MNQYLKKIASAGYIAKGIVYALSGILALLAAFNIGGEKAGKLQIIDFLENQIFGNWLVVFLGLGLICYGIWRFMESVFVPQNTGTDPKDIVKRISFFISGVIYFGLGIFSILDVFGKASFLKGGSDSGNPFLTGTYVKYIFITIGLALAGKGIYQFINVYKGNFLKKFQLMSISGIGKRKYIKSIAYAGLISRGIVTLIISYFFLKAGLNLSGNTSNEMKGTAEAFSFIQEQAYGKWLLVLIAAGLVCYGLYMFTMAASRKFNT